MEHVASKGFGMTCTVNRGRLPSKAPSEHWHKALTKTDDRCKAARFENPVVAVKRDCHKWGNKSVCAHTSFQSTSSCNIAHLDAINSCELCAQPKERGRAMFKRTWAVEMNQSRQLCLNSHGKIDKIDHMIKNCNMCCRSWKCWHAPMIHAKALAVVAACDMHLKCAEENLNEEWKTNPVDFH